jgi:hypothetical protein
MGVMEERSVSVIASVIRAVPDAVRKVVCKTFVPST